MTFQRIAFGPLDIMGYLWNIFMTHRKIPSPPGINECASYLKRRVIGVVGFVELPAPGGPRQHPGIQFRCPWAWRDVLRPGVEHWPTPGRREGGEERRREQLFLANPPLMHVAVPSHNPLTGIQNPQWAVIMTSQWQLGLSPRSLCAPMVVRWFSIPALITTIFIAPYLIFYTRSSLCTLNLNTDCNPITPGIKRSFN